MAERRYRLDDDAGGPGDQQHKRPGHPEDVGALDEAGAELAVALGAAHRLGAPAAVHLATAVAAGAERFLTNNRRDFPQTIAEIAVTYPDELPEPD